MRVILYECKKALTSPILIALILLFTAFNIFLIISSSFFNEELIVANQLAKTYGVKITDQSLDRLRQDLQRELVKLHEVTRKHTGQEFSSINEFLDSMRNEKVDLYSQKDWAFFKQLQLKELYYNLAKNIDNDYRRIDWKKIGEGQIKKYSLRGSAAETLRNEHVKLSQRFEELQENGEHKQWFFLGNPYRMHSFLFRTIFGHLIFESLILIVLATALITNYEFENKTHLVTYSTKRGRRLMKDKVAASLLTTTAITAFLLMITLGTYFSVYDYSHLWGSSINSGFNWEYKFPYVSWWNLTFLTFLLLTIPLLYVGMLLFSAITFTISVLIKNSYFTFFIFGALFTIAFMMPGFMPQSSNLIFITAFTPSTLVLNPHMFFMGNSELTMFKYYEVITIGIWTIIAGALCILALKKFNQQEIH